LIEKGVEPQKVETVPNWSRDYYTEEQLSEEDRNRFFPPGKFHILYAGNLGVVQALDIVLLAADYFRKTQAPILFTFLGAGADEERLKKRKAELGLDNVQFLPRVNGDEVVKYLNSADALFVHLKNTDLFEITIPSKILSYLRTGKPILLGLRGNAADILNESQSGFLFEPENVEDLIEKILLLSGKTEAERKEMGRRGKNYYDENLSIKSSTDKLENAFLDLLSSKGKDL
jgi:glycosyltransferase involved in cell wall biosynthesis